MLLPRVERLLEADEALQPRLPVERECVQIFAGDVDEARDQGGRSCLAVVGNCERLQRRLHFQIEY